MEAGESGQPEAAVKTWCSRERAVTGVHVKTIDVQTQRVVTVQLTERELYLLRAALSDVQPDHDGVRLLLEKAGQPAADDDDFTDLFGQLGQVLR